MDFLGSDNKCGQQLLRLVARGNRILAGLDHLSAKIPPHFSDPKSDYAKILFDFSYLKDEDRFDMMITNDPVLVERDEMFREGHLEALQEFYDLFEAIWRYISDLNTFWEEIREGFYIQQTFETILVNPDGKRLMAEALYLFGVMLLELDRKIDGGVRERMLIAFMRYRGSHNVEHLDEVCRLVRNTGFSRSAGGKRPQGYPEEYFRRAAIPEDICDMIIGRIRSDDIYQMARDLPAPEHRSTALATQAGMLYVLLYFRPQLLHESKPVMREIVDKHFPDNWVISAHLGMTVDLSVQWAPYKAASHAIKNTMQLDNIQYFQKEMAKKLRKLLRQLDEYLREGVLVESFVLDEIHSSLLPCVRDCNVVLRWFLLHNTVKYNKALHEEVMRGVSEERVLTLLLKTSQLEFLLQEMFTVLIEKKERKWQELQEKGSAMMERLATFFSGEGVLSSVTVEEGLSTWFGEIAERIEELDSGNSTAAGQQIQSLIKALKDVEEYHQVDSNLQVMQYLSDTRQLLKTMVRYVNVEERVVDAVKRVGDFTYGWSLVPNYVRMTQEKIRNDPSLVIEMRSTFMKMTSVVTTPLKRISEARSPDFATVSDHYVNKLQDFVRGVLKVIPESMFEQLERIIRLVTGDVLKPIPTRFLKDDLKQYAQLDDRYEFAETTFRIAKYTEGMLAMPSMGLKNIEPQKLLEDGIRKVLIEKLTRELHKSLQFDHIEGKSDKVARSLSFQEHLQQLAHRLAGIRLSLEYAQDYMNVYGLKIWQEEFSRLINHAVEMESNNYLAKQTYEWQSRYQSEVTIQLPENANKNFMGRVVKELLAQTDSRRTLYIDQYSGWYNEAGQVVAGLQTFKALHASIGTAGMAGTLRLLSFVVVRDLQRLLKVVRVGQTPPSPLAPLIDQMQRECTPASALPRELRTLYVKSAEAGKRTIWPAMLEVTIRVGQCQLLKKQIQKTLQFACKLDSGILYNTLRTLNEALVGDVEAHYKDPEACRYPNGRQPILQETAEFLEKCGMNDAFTQIYVTAEPIPQLPLVLAGFVISYLSRFYYDARTDTLAVRRNPKDKNPEALDGAPFVVGVVTILKQFHSDEKDKFIAFLCQYCRGMMATAEAAQQKVKEKEREMVPHEVCNAMLFLDSFCRYSAVDWRQVENLVPPFLAARYREFATMLPPRK